MQAYPSNPLSNVTASNHQYCNQYNPATNQTASYQTTKQYSSNPKQITHNIQINTQARKISYNRKQTNQQQANTQHNNQSQQAEQTTHVSK